MLRLVGSVIAALMAVPAFAVDSNYLNLQGAIADVEDLDNGVTGIVTAGVVMPHIHPRFAVEGEFSLSVIEPEAGNGADLSYFTLGGYAVMSYPFHPQVELRGRAGLVYQDAEVEGGGSDSDFGLSFGVGFVTPLNKGTHLIGEITVIDGDANINHFSAGVQFRF